ncbi:hypothetical protein N207_01875 [Helicobacter pylori UM114]|uniref:Uncharacterized protein n=1 Tax=Helicobacter pylori UM114 TaxID=1355531 RepID=T0G582_HELPX|nr:hypothetical protein N207_01875 [Helicobacter pylori UM114]
MDKIIACPHKLFGYWIVKNTKKHFLILIINTPLNKFKEKFLLV